MSSTPSKARQGNSYSPQAPAITITAVHRESLVKPAHITILHHKSRTMFSAKPAHRPAPPPKGSNGLATSQWFKQPNAPKENITLKHPSHQKKPKPLNPQSLDQENSQSRCPQVIRKSSARDPESFDGWMAKFCIEPRNDVGACCLSFWAPYAQYGKTHWRLQQVEDGRDPSDANWQVSYGCNGPCWAWFGTCCLLNCDCVLTGLQRTRVRATYGIQGSISRDLFLSAFCRPCTMVQMDREVRAREGDTKLRTNGSVININTQPSQSQPMRYVSPRQTVSDNFYGREQNIQNHDDRGDPLSGHPYFAKLQKHFNSEITRKPPKLNLANQGTSQMKPNPLRAEGYIDTGGPPPMYHKSAPNEKTSIVKKPDPAQQAPLFENKNNAGSRSVHSLVDYAPKFPLTPDRTTQPQECSLIIEVGGSKGMVERTYSEAAANEGLISDCTVADSDTIIASSSKPSKRNARSTIETHELSYIHDFTDCPVDKNVLEFYEKEEKQSQQQSPADVSLTSSHGASQQPSSSQHTFANDLKADSSSMLKPTSVKSTGSRQHALSDCTEKEIEAKNNSKTKSAPSRLANSRQHALSDCTETGTNA